MKLKTIFLFYLILILNSNQKYPLYITVEFYDYDNKYLKYRPFYFMYALKQGEKYRKKTSMTGNSHILT